MDRLPNGNYALQVHIADVSHYVTPGSPIDEEAALRGTSVYFPDRAVPMLPLELSTEICSLKPGVDRLVLSVLLEIDHRGDVVSQEFARGVIRSVERMTYTNVHALLEGDAALRERYARLVPRFELMQELALILNSKRVQRGAIDFDMPEPLIEFDEVRRNDRRQAQPPQHRAPLDRRVHAGRQRSRRLASGTSRTSRPSSASTKSPTPSASWNSKRSPPTSAIRSASAPCRSNASQ